MTTIGWECPRCHRCYAPSITQCPHCGGNYQGGGVPIFPSYPPYTNCYGSGTVTSTEGQTYVTYNFTSNSTKENNA